MSRLAEIHSAPGLPRGRGRLDPEAVGRAQRERLLRAVVSAVAELGYANVRIADVVDRARVSRHSFYGQFADKEACFLAAHAHGVDLILRELASHIGDPPADPRETVRAAVAAYLNLAADEPEFAHCMLIELQAIGPRGLEARLTAHRQIATLLRAWHELARSAHPGWPAIPASRYAAAVGAVHDLVFDLVAGAGPVGADDVEAAVDAVLTLMEIPPRT